jgi:hypothetical protein
MVRIQIVLNPQEGRALTNLADRELRDPRDQVRLIVRQELERLGLLPPAEGGQSPVAPDVGPVEGSSDRADTA